MNHITRHSTQKTTSSMHRLLTASLSRLGAKLSLSTNSPRRFVGMLALMMLPYHAYSGQAVEEAEQTTLKTYSAGQTLSGPERATEQQLLTRLQQKITLDNNDQLLKKSGLIERDAIIAEKLQNAQRQSEQSVADDDHGVQKAANAISTKSSLGSYFSIYDAYATLIEDRDGDGYYQTFSVTFDADLVSYNPYEEAIVYAELYLSENGGPWEHYYSSDYFVITGESEADKFEVISTLGEGFNPNHYDVLIDIYEANSPILMATYSSDDSNSLYALPLEGHYHDTPYQQEVYIQGGSYSISAILLLSLMAGVRYFRAKKKQ